MLHFRRQTSRLCFRLLFETLSLIFFLNAAGLASATGSIEGTVIDRVSHKPAEGATVRVVNGSDHAVADTDGWFAIRNLEPGDYILSISHVGYRPVDRHLSVTAGVDISFLVELEPAAVPVGTITVTPTRTGQEEFTVPLSISVTSSETFSQRGFSTTAELLRGEPGVLVQKTTHGHGSPILRGLLGKYVLLLYDGIRLNKPTFRFGANQYLNTVDFETLGSVEVVRGPSSVMFGSDAVGGVINLVPAVPRIDTSRGNLAYKFVGRFSGADAGRSAHLRVAGARNSMSGSYEFTHKQIGDLRGGGDAGIQSPTGWIESDHTARLHYWLGRGRSLRLDLQAVNQNEVPRYDKYVCGAFEQYVYEPQDRYLATLILDSPTAGLLFDASKIGISYQKELEGRRQQRRGSPAVSYARDAVQTWGGYAQFWSRFRSQHWLTYGVEHYRHLVRSSAERVSGSTIEPVRSTFPDNSEYWSLGVFLQDEWFLRDRFCVTTGMRYSLIGVHSPLELPFAVYNKVFADLTGSAAASYLVAPSVNVVGRWSRGFRAPNLNDAVVLKYSSSGVDAPSPHLVSENCSNFELGVKVSSARLTGSAFAFYNVLADLIERQPGSYDGLTFFDENGNRIRDPGEFDVFQKANSGRARIYGFELESEFAAGRGLTLEANRAWTFGENLTEQKPLSRIPPLLGRVGLGGQVNSCLHLGGNVRFAGPQERLSARDMDDSRIDPGGTPGWLTLNLNSRLTFSGVSLDILLDNLLDMKYKEHGSGIYSPGRNIVVSAGWGGP